MYWYNGRVKGQTFFERLSLSFCESQTLHNRVPLARLEAGTKPGSKFNTTKLADLPLMKLGARFAVNGTLHVLDVSVEKTSITS